MDAEAKRRTPLLRCAAELSYPRDTMPVVLSLVCGAIAGLLAGSAPAQEEAGARSDVARAESERELPSLESFSYEPLYDGWLARDLLGTAVIGAENREIGAVENLLLNRRGEVVAVIAEIREPSDGRAAHVAVPWNDVEQSDQGLRLPASADELDDYSLFAEEYFSSFDVAEPAVVEDEFYAGPGVWKATELLHDYVFLDEDGYGYVTDLVFDQDAALLAVVASVDGEYGYRAFPWLGAFDYPWRPSQSYYRLPYDEEEIDDLQLFEEERMR